MSTTMYYNANIHNHNKFVLLLKIMNVQVVDQQSKSKCCKES